MRCPPIRCRGFWPWPETSSPPSGADRGDEVRFACASSMRMAAPRHDPRSRNLPAEWRRRSTPAGERPRGDHVDRLGRPATGRGGHGARPVAGRVPGSPASGQAPSPPRARPRRTDRAAPPIPIRSQGERPMTTTPRTVERDLMELVRGDDPLDGHVDPVTDEAGESLLREILAAPRPERTPKGSAEHEGGRSARRRGGRRRGCRRSDHRDHRDHRRRPGWGRSCLRRASSGMRSPPLSSPPARSCMWT